MYFLNINKPKGISSFDVIRRLRKILNIKQIGHSGTLDPLASGVMQIGVGNATKLLDFLPSDKIYVADICFGYVSETFDNEGVKTFVKTPDFAQNELNEALKSFLGKTFQIPPKYSAIKVNGHKLCDIVRRNEAKSQLPKIEPREIEIYSIQLLDFGENSFVFEQNSGDETSKKITAKIKVHCKKGTYIRSLVNDLGQKLGCGAFLIDLKRIKAGNFDIENSDFLPFDDNKIKDMNKIQIFNKINPLDCLSFEKYELDKEEYSKIQNGNFIQPKKNLISAEDEFVLLTKNNKLVSIAKISDNLIKPKKFFKEG